MPILVFLFFAWLVVMVIGIIIALLPIICFILGFVLAIGFFSLIASAFGHAFG